MFDPKDIRIDPYFPKGEPRLSLGYSTNGVTVTHIKTGVTASVTTRSQHQSREIAMEMVEWGLTYADKLEEE
jgi:protein subunit release factor A